MEKINPVDLLRKSATACGMLLNECPKIENARTYTVSTIGIMLYYISDSQWERIMEIANDPCDQPMCDCHEWTGKLLGALDEHRKYVKRTADGPRP